MDIFKAISELTTLPGVSGNETVVAEKVLEYFRTYTDDVWLGRLGNAYARIGDKKGPTLFISAHMDEVGMMVTDIEDNGMLRIRSVAGVDPRVLPGSEVLVFGKKPLKGVIGAIPPHLLGQERKEAYRMDELTCDIGYPLEKVKKLVSVGDYVTYAPLAPMKLKNDNIAGKTFDDRACVVMMLQTMDILKNRKLNCNVVFCASVQEERGSHGALTGSFEVNPDMAIAIDVCHAPTPGTEQFDTIPLEKAALCVGGNIHPKIYKRLTELAAENHIDTGIDVCMGQTGTDAWEIQITHGGHPTGLISLPLRYMHTNVELINLETLKNCSRLLAAFAEDIGADWEEKLCLDD